MGDGRGRRTSKIVLVAAVFLASTGLFVWVGVGAPDLDPPSRQAAPGQAAPVRSATEPASAAVSGIDEAALREAIARILREELGEILATGAMLPETVRAVAPVQSPEQVEAQARAYDDTRRVVDTALSSGRWTNDDAAAFRATYAHLTADQREAVMGSLLPAINRGEIQIETEGPPF